MKSDNLIQISGYLPKDAFINDKETFASFTIAHNVSPDKPMYISCVIFSKSCPIPFNLLQKGKEVFVKGSLRPYEYKSGNATVKTLQVVVEKIRDSKE